MPNANVPTSKRLKTQRGAALVMVIWCIGVLSFCAAQIAVSARLSYHKVDTHAQLVVVDFLLEGAIRKAVSDWDHGVQNDVGAFYSCETETGTIFSRVVPANARLSINTASEATLAKLIEEIGIPKIRASSFAAAIIDYRDADSNPRPHGAESQKYESLGLSYRPKNGPMTSTIELNYIPGLETDLIERLRDETSAHNHSPSINYRFASPLVQTTSSAQRDTQTVRTQGRFSNRRIQQPPTSRSHGVAPIIVVASVKKNDLRRTVEVTFSEQSPQSGRRRVIEYRPIYHYHPKQEPSTALDPCI